MCAAFVYVALSVGALSVSVAEPDRQAALIAPIAAQPLGQALQAFAAQTGLNVAYLSGLVRGLTSQPVPAGLGAQEALTRLLRGTGLRFEFLNARSIRLLADDRSPGPVAPHGSQSNLPSVVVTGSRIPVPANVTTASPLVIVTAQDILMTGYTDAGDVISVLPQMITTGIDSGKYGLGNLGTTTADLRGLGPERTVVLINGKRLGVADSNTGNLHPGPDLDQVPLPMIERVEVLTGGASAIYGADAVAGVVNFILKDHVQGVQADAQYGFAQHTQHAYYIQSIQAASGIRHPTGRTIDGRTRDVSVLAGTQFHDGDGQITGYFVYHGQDPLEGADRDFSSCSAIGANLATSVPTQDGVKCLGSSVSSNMFAAESGDGSRYSVVGGQFVPWPAAGSIPPARFDFAPYQSLQRQDNRYQTGLLTRFEFNPAVKPYLDFSFMSDRSQLQQAPSGLFFGGNPFSSTGGFLVNCSNPLLSAEEAAILCTPGQIAGDKAHPGSASADVLIGRRNVEGGPRVTTFAHENYRAVTGVGGKLNDAWSYDLYALYYRTSLFRTNRNDLNVAAVANSLQVTSDRSGHPMCISGGDCVPYDIFTEGAVTPRQLAYLSATGTDGGPNTEQVIEANITGELGRYGLTSPWAHAGVDFNAGADHRTETLRYTPDATELSGVLSGFGHAFVAVDQRVSVSEGFLEARIPIAQNRRLLHDLTVDAGYRYSVYSIGEASHTYRIDLQFAPVADIGIRTSFNRVVRAPTLIELYTPVTASITEIFDPCAPIGSAHATASLIQCMRMGVTPAQYGNGVAPAFGGTDTIRQCLSGCPVLLGGNSKLSAETADTWSLGITVAPTAIADLSASVDYFLIRLKRAIGTIPPDVTLNQCLATGDPTWCGQIVRTSAGALSGTNVSGGGYIVQTDVNTGAALVSGIDVQANYRQPLPGGWGVLTAGLNGSWLRRKSSTPYYGAASYDCAGLFGASCNGSANPTWRHTLRLIWDMRWDLRLSAQWRFIGRTGFDNNSSQIPLKNAEEGFFDPVLTHIPNYSYLDLSVLWDVARHLQVRAGVNNVLDKDPPFVPSVAINTFGSFNTLPGYDIVGREIFLAVHATF